MKPVIRRVTVKNLQESLGKALEKNDNLQLEAQQWQKDCYDARDQKYKLEKSLKGSEARVRDLEWTNSNLKAENKQLNDHLIEEDARAEAFEFVLRLQHGAPVVAPPSKPQGLDAQVAGVSPLYDVYRRG